MRKIALFTMLLFSCVCHGQAKIDSLVNNLKKLKNDDSLKVKAYISLASAYNELNHKQSIRYGEMARELSSKLKWKKGLGLSELVIGKTYLNIGRFDTSMVYFNRSMSIYRETSDTMGIIGGFNNIGTVYLFQSKYHLAKLYFDSCYTWAELRKDRSFMAASLGNVGNIFLYTGNYSRAITQYLAAQKIYQELKNQMGVSTCYTNIGAMYENLKNYEKALEYNKKAIVIDSTMGNLNGLAAGYGNIANLYGILKKTQLSIYYHSKSISLFEKTGNEHSLALEHKSIGYMYMTISDTVKDPKEKKALLTKGLDYCERSISTFKKEKDLLGLAGGLLNKANILLRFDRYVETDRILKEVLAINKELNSKQIELYVYDSYVFLYEGKKDHKKSLDYYKKYNLLEKEIAGEDKKSEIEQNQLQSEFDKKIVTDSTRNAEAQKVKDSQIEAQEAKLDQQRITQIALFGGLSLILVFAIVVYNRYKLTQKQKYIIEEQKLVVDEKNRDIIDSINYAKHIQNAILPSEEFVKERLPESFVLYQPKDIVSGDFYFVGSPTTNKGAKLVVASVADCTGHGVPGAFLTLLGKTFLQLSLTENNVNSCAEGLDFLNVGLSNMLNRKDRAVTDGMDISLCAINFDTKQLEFAGANNSVYIIRNNELTELKADKQSVGQLTDNKELLKFTNKYFTLEKDDMLYLFSDGYIDQFGGSQGKKFKSSQFKKLLTEISTLPIDTQKETIISTFVNWKGEHPQLDDICVFGIRI